MKTEDTQPGLSRGQGEKKTSSPVLRSTRVATPLRETANCAGRLKSDSTDLLIACEQKCASLQAQHDELLIEAFIARGASAGANAEDPAPSPSGLTML